MSNPFESMYQSLLEARNQLAQDDTRPYGKKTVIVIHPAMRSHLEQFKPDDPYQSMMGMIGGMPVREHLHRLDDNGEVVQIKHDEMFFVHENSLWRFIGADWIMEWHADDTDDETSN